MSGRYSMGQVAKLLGVHKNTLYRWETKGLIPRQQRLARTGERIYTDDDIERIRAFKDEVVPPPPAGGEQGAEAEQ